MIIITVARKPYPTSTTACVLDNGCGGLNINDTRIRFASEQDKWKPAQSTKNIYGAYMDGSGQEYKSQRQDGSEYEPTKLDAKPNDNGRFPANLLLSIEAKPHMDKQSGITKTGDMDSITKAKPACRTFGAHLERRTISKGSVGYASRYFKVFGDEK